MKIWFIEEKSILQDMPDVPAKEIIKQRLEKFLEEK